MNEHYAAVLSDLRARRAKLETELRDVDVAITSIQKLLGGTTAVALGSSPQFSPQAPAVLPAPTLKPQHRFSNISVRWSVLWYLAEDMADKFARTSEIANALLAGGYKSEAVRFANLVSAVLSGMKGKGEVETNDDGGYRLTEQGRLTWANIRIGSKFKFATSPSEHSLLSVQ
jgi:hypothetical protein